MGCNKHHATRRYCGITAGAPSDRRERPDALRQRRRSCVVNHHISTVQARLVLCLPGESFQHSAPPDGSCWFFKRALKPEASEVNAQLSCGIKTRAAPGEGEPGTPVYENGDFEQHAGATNVKLEPAGGALKGWEAEYSHAAARALVANDGLAHGGAAHAELHGAAACPSPFLI